MTYLTETTASASITRPSGHHDGATPLLLTHGFSASSAMWQPNIEALSAARPVITWDLRGHGSSDAPDDLARYSAEACVADMAALLDACGIARVVAGGLSLGGYLSLEFCLAHPDRVAGLVLCDTGPGYRRDEARQQWNDRAIALAERLERDSARGLARAARGILTQRDARVIDALPAITIPALVLVGARDKDYLGAAEYMAAKLPRRRARGDPGCRPRMQRRPAGPVQPAGARLPGPARSPLSTPRLGQPGYLLLGQAGLGQYLTGMLPGQRRRPSHRCRGRREPGRRRDHLVPSGVADARPRAARR